MLQITKMDNDKKLGKLNLYLSGRLDDLTISYFQETIERVSKNKLLEEIVINLSDVVSIDSVGINKIKNIIILLDKKNIYLKLEGCTEVLFDALLNHYKINDLSDY